MSGIQITIVGGGSYQWTPELLADLLSTSSLQGSRIVLHDIAPEPLEKMAALGGRINEAVGAKASLVVTTDQRRALEGADFVIVTISTGGFASMAVDLDVPAAYGIHQSVGDTVGPGGINRALRNVPVLVDLARHMEQLCPHAWLLNITNPLTCLTRAVCRHSNVKAVGLCHEVGNFCLDLAIALGLPADKVRPTVVGVNHFPVVTSLAIDGAEGFAILGQVVDSLGGLAAVAPGQGAAPGEAFSQLDFAQRNFLKLSLLERWGVLPAAGDRHLAEFFASVLTEESAWGATWGVELTSIATRMEHQRGFERHVDDMLSGAAPLVTWQSGELPAPVIDSLVTGERRQLPVNIPNTGQCPDLPDEAIVECIGVVDAHGIGGRDIASAPPGVTELLRRHVAVQEMAVDAAVRADRKEVLEAFALDPLSGRLDLRRQATMVQELMEGTARWLPQFADAPEHEHHDERSGA